MPSDWAANTVRAQRADEQSMFHLYASGLRRRRTEPALGNGELEWQPSAPGVLDFRRPHEDAPIRVVVNLSSEPVALPPGDVILSSEPTADRVLPTDTAVWIRESGRR
jgi:alpha-glucosidase